MVRFLNAKNEASILAGSNLQVARAYMVASDPHMPKRTWQEIVDFTIGQKDGPNKHHWISFYEVLWYTGGSQTDVAHLHGEDINWKNRTIFYRHKKTGSDAMPRFGDRLAAVLARRPKSGPLFP